MPIYAYRCESCGHAKDVLQKVSDPVLSTCPACQRESFKKQITAAGFQLKGSGWYATDFRGGSSAAKPDATPADGPKAGGDAKTESAPAAAAPPASAAAGGTAPSGGCGTSCACH
jgi:putative FmdB family regulatory protein